MSKLIINTWSDENDYLRMRRERKAYLVYFAIVIAIVVFWSVILMSIRGCAVASTVINEPNIAGYSLNQWCHAIYLAEGGSHTRHPYGVLAHYRHTTPLEACQNTVRHKWHDYLKLTVQTRQEVTFLNYLTNKYCPVGCDNDIGTNKNWSKNVNYWLKHS